MKEKRTLRKIEAMCSDKLDFYECDACMWILNVEATKSLQEVEMNFKVHDCDKNSMATMLASASKN